MTRHILYCNDNAHVLVLDLPASISHAQASVRSLCSTAALAAPYQTPDPKGVKRDALLARIPIGELEYHETIQNLIAAKLTFLHEEWHEPSWCGPRAISNDNRISVEHPCLNPHGEGFPPMSCSTPPLVLSAGQTHFCCLSAMMNIVVQNPYSSSTELAISTGGSFIIPANATFLSASIDHGVKSFETAVQCLRLGRHFDLVLLDPPWGNRSVRRSQVYKTAETQLSDPFRQVFPVVKTCLSEQGYIAVWVTNKAGVRAQVLGTCQSAGFVLEEEWIWLKVTTQGQPMTPLNGIWRKPYEILLLFRRNSESRHVVRRIIIAVPDHHSRKPSLKSIFDRILPEHYDALEVFARSLTAGWWSWGDETLKFQHESHWQ